jgi:CheY-like chemotaxis protein
MTNENSTARLLVVDDEEELLWSVSQRLRKERPRLAVATATNGHDALAMLDRERFDVLVADLRMPAMSGMELVLAARSKRPRLPVVVMTAYPTADVMERINETGAIEFLEKPFDFNIFVGAIERALDRGRVGFSGAIQVQTLPDVIQLYALSGASGALAVMRGDLEGTIWFDRGSIPYALTPTLSGAQAFYEIMSWQGGSFAMRAGEVAPHHTVLVPWMELLSIRERNPVWVSSLQRFAMRCAVSAVNDSRVRRVVPMGAVYTCLPSKPHCSNACHRVGRDFSQTTCNQG